MRRQKANADGVKLKIVSKKIRSSANGEDCTLNILRVCNYDPSTVVFCHFPSESKGMSKKSDDISGGYGCFACHQVIDGVVKSEEFKEFGEWYLRRSMTRTHLKLIDKGIMVIK